LAGLTALVLPGCVLSPPELPEVSSYELQLPVLRELADAPIAALPRSVNVAIVADSSKPAAGVVGGLRFDTTVLVWTAFQIVHPDGFIVVDSPPDIDFHRQSNGSDSYSPEQFDRVQQAMRAARLILVTHEHPDHIGGIARSPYLEELLPRLLLTGEQVGNATEMEAVQFPPEALSEIETLDYEQYHRVAPGVVVVQAPGHTPGSQLIYVRLQSGKELILAGDTGWHRSQIELPRGRPRISSWLMAEDADTVGHQLVKLHELSRDASVAVIVSHDREQLEAYIHDGVLGAAFESL
jgi:glyoxylase-like metal-dependent hydrolase (beta-lactamase superfamily II)